MSTNRSAPNITGEPMMEQKKGLTYKEAGVDTKEGERAVDLMKEHVKKTFNDSVLTGLGGFGSLFKLDVGAMKEPVLVSGTDGVGTKLKLAFTSKIGRASCRERV